MGEEAETTATTVAEPKKDVLPLVFSGLALAGTVGLGLFTLFKKPAEAASTAEKLVDDVARKQIETLEKTVATQAQELAEKATRIELAGVEKGIQQTVDDAVNTATLGIQATLATHESNLDDLRRDAGVALIDLDTRVSDIQKTVDRTKQQITSQEKGIEGITQRLDATIPVIGNNVVVDPSVKHYFVGDGLNNLAVTLDKSEALNNSVTQLTNYIQKGVFPTGGFENIEVDSFIHQLFDYLKETHSTMGNTTYSLIHKMSHILDEVPRSGYDIFTINPTKKLPKADYIPALMDTLEYVQNVYNGVPTDENIFKLTSSAFISEKELKQKINAVLDAAAKENGGSKEKVNQAQANLMTWLENIFTKSRVENFNANNKAPMKTLPAPHPSSDWVMRDRFFEGDKPLAELTQTLLGKGFKGGEGAENPYTLTDVAILSDAIGALQRALMKEQGYFTLEEGVLNAPKGSLRSELARTLNRIAKTLIPITPEAIEAGLVPLRVVEVDPKKPYLPDEMWNARLNGNAEEVKAVTQKMFEELRGTLFDSNTIRMPIGGTTKPQVEKIFEKMNKATNLEKFSELANQFDDNSITSKPSPEVMIKQLFDELAGVNNDIGTASSANDILSPNMVSKQFKDVFHFVITSVSNNTENTAGKTVTKEKFGSDYPRLIQLMQAVIDSKTKEVTDVQTAQTELMAFLKKHFYEKPTSS